MKRTLVFVFALLLITGLAWAEEPVAVTDELVLDDAALEGGGCILPDFSGLSEDEIQAAALGAGFEQAPTQAAVQACPTKFSCNSITNCGASSVCSVTDIGQCCTTSGGLGFCCITGTIKVRKCPCVCTGNPCNIICPQSTDVKWRCR